MMICWLTYCCFFIYSSIQLEGYHDITSYVSVHDFEVMKEMIRKTGKHDPHRVYDSQLPYTSFDSLNLYLTGRDHIGEFLTDPNEIGIVNLFSNLPSPHFSILIVRKGDPSRRDLPKVPGLKEEHVYLRYQNNEPNSIAELQAFFLKSVLPRIKKKIVE